METGKLIKEIRIEKGMTQEELASKTEVSARTIQRIENGEVDPRAYTLHMIAKALDVEFEMFIEKKTDERDSVNTNHWLGLLHLSGIIPIFFPTILIWKHKKGAVKGMNDHYRVVISFQLVILGVALGSLWVYWWTNQLTPLIGVLLAGGLFSVINAIKVLNGDTYINLPFVEKTEKDLKTK